jgi:hypothetical protein
MNRADRAEHIGGLLVELQEPSAVRRFVRRAPSPNDQLSHGCVNCPDLPSAVGLFEIEGGGRVT